MRNNVRIVDIQWDTPSSFAMAPRLNSNVISRWSMREWYA
jgi:hypothetical protein